MCGIFATTWASVPDPKALNHRGPDSYTHQRVDNVELVFWRLAINGIVCGEQPFHHKEKFLIANAEIYNHVELGGTPGNSDCEIILPLVEKFGLMKTCQMISGDFAFVITDGTNIWAARDRVGVRPLYYCRSLGGISFGSEMKALVHIGEKIEIFPPGHIYDSELDKFIYWPTNSEEYWYGKPTEIIKTLLTEAVQKRVSNSERPVGFFLSGGLDSSIVAAVGKEIIGPGIKTFAIGIEGSPDLLAARKMADFLGSDHTEVLFTVQEGLDVLEKVIWTLETFDTTTVRASVPMYLLSKYIKERTDIRVVLSGEGSDELFGGYLYFHGAPSKSAFVTETMRLAQDVHMFDVLRADRTTAAHGLELRVPFFDRDFIDYVMSGFNSELKLPKDGLEKYILRGAFSDLLPPEIAWRQKNGMSDAVGYSWVDALRTQGEDKYQEMFEKYYAGQNHVVPYKWMPRWSTATDPSARVLDYFKS